MINTVKLPKRNFKGGSWDLRKEERRKAQVMIDFRDRRMADRRALPGAFSWLSNFQDESDGNRRGS